MAEVVARWQPDTSDKSPDENWFEYWDRKRHERHGENCSCVLCRNEDALKPNEELVRAFCES